MVYAAQNGRGRKAIAAVQTVVRAVVYTRKSTSEGLNREFNSLDNQRERAEAYAASQDWTVLEARYDDGGFSGKTTDRPALQRLLADAENRLFDVIVVYKLDRLSRSLCDFVNLHRVLEKCSVEIVSVTEPIDTRTPMGRAFVNILVSFGQMEREQTAERTRDKMSAARRRGKWTGGMPPLGYDVAPGGGKIIINSDESPTVVSIFELYLERGSILAVAQELRRRGVRRKTWTTRDGKLRVGREWNNVDVHRVLTNPLYGGMQKLRGETFKGEHQAIIPKKTFERVQRMLVENRRNGGASHRNRHGALLRGILRCAACDSAMTHMFNRNRHGRDYRYYRCVNAVKNGAEACPTGSVPAAKIEAFVVEQIKKIGADPALCEETFRQVQAQVAAEQRATKTEAKRVDRDIAAVRGELDRLASAVARAHRSAADALIPRLADTQERLTTLERRQHEVAQRQAALDDQEVESAAVGRALAQFTELWDVLLTPERERVVRLLIDRVDYHCANGELKITFSATGARHLVADLASAESTS
jgi:site-specific DNA recombinase